MPSSYIDSVPPIVKTIVSLDPTNVLDVGPGWGKYGLACREYLPRLGWLWAIEVPEGRLPLQDAIYDQVLSVDVRTYVGLDGWPFKLFDLVLLIDVIEHMPVEDGHAMLNHIQSCGCQILVSTPQVFTAQAGEVNPHEKHVSLWAWEDFQPHGIVTDASTIDSIIYVLESR